MNPTTPVRRRAINRMKSQEISKSASVEVPVKKENLKKVKVPLKDLIAKIKGIKNKCL